MSFGRPIGATMPTPVSAEAPPDETRERQGDVLGSYALERPLGEGAMGRVWLGRHVKLGRNAAIKVLKSEHTQNSELVGRFFDEARAVNQINHEHIVAISDFVEELEPPRVYCVMEYLPGESLERQLGKEPLPMAEALSVMRQVCDALAAAHKLGIVHRDVKPDNIFLMSKVDGSLFAKVLDFGVAKLTPSMKREAVSTTQQGQIIGTPQYMAPEQLVGLEVDPKADVYAAGTVLYRLLAGHLPFPEDDVGKLTLAVIKQAPSSLPSKTASGERIPRAVAKVVMAALSKEPEARPTAEELSAVLALAQRGEPKRSVAPAAFAAGVFVAVGLGLFFALKKPDPVPPPPQPVLSATVKLTVRTEPPGATVTAVKSGEVLGSTPLAKDLPRGEPLELRIAMDGYLPLQRSISAEADAVVDVVLAEAQRPQPSPPPPPPPAETVRPAKKPKKMPVSEDGTIDPFGK